MINKPYKLKRSEFDQILFTSDTHYSHDPKWDIPLWQRRNFNNVNEHDQWLENEYKKISPNSLIIHLGDVALNSTPEKLLNLFRMTESPIWLIWGNHFSCDYALYRSAINKFIHENLVYADNNNNNNLDVTAPLKFEIYPFTIDKTLLYNDIRLQHSSVQFLVNGYPEINFNDNKLSFLGSQTDILIDKTLIHLSHMAPHIWTRGAISLFGHSHGEAHGMQPEDTDSKRLDCGIENSMKYNGSAFFSWEEIQTIMASKKNITHDTHT
jgi:predicted phosphodiesterase